LLASIKIGSCFRGKVDASDLVQETFLEAHRNFHLFQGTEELQFACWLRQILAARVANLIRYYFSQKRDIRLEQRLDDPENPSPLPCCELARSMCSPSQQAARREQAGILADALEQLPQHYREVMILRHFEELTFPEVARKMNRTQDSVEALWRRAIVRLRQLLANHDEIDREEACCLSSENCFPKLRVKKR
jgi:RNA polymerase sigma-70 factor (ECF subfamily)